MLDITGLHVHYGSTHAVQEVDMHVAEAGTLALLGSNGAGKSSILKAVSGLIPYDGRITFDGADLGRLSPERRARAGLIQVPEGRRMIGSLSVHENLQLGQTALAGRKAGFDIADVYEVFPALRYLRNRPSWALSGGQQQMVAIGRALVAGPRLLILDEPSLGLAPRIVKEVFAVLRTITVQVPVLLVEQNSTAAVDLCTQVVVLASGRVVFRGLPEEATSGDVLHRAYLGLNSEGAARA